MHLRGFYEKLGTFGRGVNNWKGGAGRWLLEMGMKLCRCFCRNVLYDGIYHYIDRIQRTNYNNSIKRTNFLADETRGKGACGLRRRRQAWRYGAKHRKAAICRAAHSIREGEKDMVRGTIEMLKRILDNSQYTVALLGAELKNEAGF